MNQLRQRLKRYFDDMTPGDAARLFMIAGVLVYVVGYLADHVFQWDLPFIAEGYSNAGVELLSIAGTVIVIDRLNQRQANRERFQELFTQMRSNDNGLATAAVDIFRLKGWLKDGSLRNADLTTANLEWADLQHADLEGVKLFHSNLEHANFWYANLKEAALVYAILEHANFERANLEGAILHMAELEGARFDENTVLPDGTKWTPNTDMRRFTDHYHPQFWRPKNYYIPKDQRDED